MTSNERKTINGLIEKWRAASAKVVAEGTYQCGNGQQYNSTPQQRAAATRAFGKMRRAFLAAGITEGEMLDILNRDLDLADDAAKAQREEAMAETMRRIDDNDLGEMTPPDFSDPEMDAHYNAQIDDHIFGRTPADDCAICLGEEPDASEATSPAGWMAPDPIQFPPHGCCEVNTPAGLLAMWEAIPAANARERAYHEALRNYCEERGLIAPRCTGTDSCQCEHCQKFDHACKGDGCECNAAAPAADYCAECGVRAPNHDRKCGSTSMDDAPADPNDCPECARSFGPHYSGPCKHGDLIPEPPADAFEALASFAPDWWQIELAAFTYCIGQVKNGGFCQLFDNAGAQAETRIDDAVTILNRVGCPIGSPLRQLHDIMTGARDLIGRYMDAENFSVLEKLEKLDEQLYAVADECNAPILAWVRSQQTEGRAN